LEDIHARMQDQEGDVVKLAVRLERTRDNLRLLRLRKIAKKPPLALGMGDMGIPSRILAAKFGAPFTYAAFNKERGIAPGILSFDEMKDVYAYDSIDKLTQVYAVIGDPIAHTMSPIAHNAAFRHLRINSIYIPMLVPKADFMDTLQTMAKVPINGYSVTLPHKQSVDAVA